MPKPTLKSKDQERLEGGEEVCFGYECGRMGLLRGRIHLLANYCQDDLQNILIRLNSHEWLDTSDIIEVCTH